MVSFVALNKASANFFKVIINVNVLFSTLPSYNKPVDKIFHFDVSSLLAKQSEYWRTTYSDTQVYILR